MADIDLTGQLVRKHGIMTRRFGRYNSSGLYGMLAGWVKAEDYMKPEEVDFDGIMRMWAGSIKHEKIEGLLDKTKCEQKVEFKYKDIILVGKADYLPDAETVWEFKTSDKITDKMKPWHSFQAKLYCTLFKRPTGIIYQPLITADKRLILHDIGHVARDDEWFNEQIEKLYAYHLKVKEINGL